MDGLPSGTVSLLFSDIEGSTLLLGRLGPAYVQALDGQRRLLRAAWASHGGQELGTEGDSFFVVFETAVDAVRAAAQGQRALDSFDWPAGERVRVRMGIHTGSPQPHDGGYIGMDVHRAARIAGSAHGGQVVISAATATLVSSRLPEQVRLVDLGSHHLKDIAVAEHLFQVAIDDLQIDFPPLKTLGAASSLPRPATPLIGRDSELAELTALLGLPHVRLVTLTGPGGSGKTRLAVGLAHRLATSFPDGAYFVSLAAVTTPEVMWTSIAEVLDVPAEGRIPPGFFRHVEHRSALFVLDNLEQLPSADQVVSQLLTAARQVVVIATSRRPLHLTGEHEHPVPTLELPDEANIADAQRSGAVQLFVQHARMVRPSFSLTDTNTTDVVEICKSLDGLPLAIELAAARSKLLSPAALVSRLDKALELRDDRADRPTRQQTLRDTIAWSYDMLTPTQQRFFRFMGVFAGGADLDAIDAVTTDSGEESDALDLVADLVDASLVTITEGPDGDPRIGMLETIRAFAQGQLQRAGELRLARRRHAEHYLPLAHELSIRVMSGASLRLESRRRFELELDNFRESLAWSLPSEDAANPPHDASRFGLRLCAELVSLWPDGGYYSEGRLWLERAIKSARDDVSPELGRCLTGLADLARIQGDISFGREIAVQSVAMWRRLGDKERLSWTLTRLAYCEEFLGDLQAARLAFEEAVSLAREIGNKPRLAGALSNQARFEVVERNLERALELEQAAVEINVELGDEMDALGGRHNMACTLREMGRLEEAHRQMHAQIPDIVRLAPPEQLIVLAEDYGAVLAEVGEHDHAVRLLGAADAMRERNGAPRSPTQDAEIARPFAGAREAMPPQRWRREYAAGQNMTVEKALTEASTWVQTGTGPAAAPTTG
jgi:predicted ATPase/class 3 adenylate cyclase